MKSKKKVFIGLFFLIITILAWGTKKNFPVLKGPYMGQKAPTAKAEPFLDGIISMLKEPEMCAAFTKNGKEFYFNKYHDNNWAIFCCREVNGKWLKPELISFTSVYTDRDFTMSPDGTKIYFGSNRPKKKGGETLSALDLFVTQMTPSGQWSEPRNIGLPVNTNYGENYPSVAQNGNLYFFSCSGEGFGGCDIYMSRRVQGRYLLAGRKNHPGYKSKRKFLRGGFMINKKKILIGAFLLVNAIFVCGGEENFPVLKGPYLGQKPPGLTPKVFAPGIVSTSASEGGSSFTSDGKLYLFVRAGSTQDGIFIMEQKRGVWQKPRLAPFSAGKYDWDFMLAPDDKTLFVSSGRPVKGGGPPVRDYRIWTTKKTITGWTKPFLLPPPVNTGQHDSYPSAAANGTLYFFSNRKGGTGNGDIYKSRRIKGKYPVVENLGKPVNSKHHEVDPFIAPDESYLIFCSDKPGGYGKDDMYISFRKSDSCWSQPINMGKEVNSPYQEYIPYVTPDGKYFFFTTNKTGNRDIYWVDAKIIDTLTPSNIK